LTCKVYIRLKQNNNGNNNNKYRTGNELTPGVMYDFKFKDYAPWVFRYLREKFHIDAADYMVDFPQSLLIKRLKKKLIDFNIDVINKQIYPV
jgi:hypothetical protein